MFEPGSPESHTLTAEILDGCSGGENFTVTWVKVDAVGFR
jgi:hypothetical protein